jgi:DNA-binding transcriptional LysR family regulator
VLDTRRLQALHAVVSTGSVKEAAATLGYSPSAISQHIAALQRETRSVLLEPAGRGVRATAAGELLAEHAAQIFEQLARAEAELMALSAGQIGSLRVASFATAGAELVPPAMARFRAELPGVELTLRSVEREEALAFVRRGIVDVAVIEAHGQPAAGKDDGLVFRPLLTDPFRVLLPRDHRLANRRVIKLAELATETWIRPRCEFDCCLAETSGAFQRAGFAPTWVAEADEYWPAQGFVAAGLGLALVPSLALGATHTNVVARRLDHSTEPTRDVIAVSRSVASTTIAVRTMLTALTSAASQQRRTTSRQPPADSRILSGP